MTEDPTPRRIFPGAFNDEFSVGPLPGNSAYFGTDVLRGLTDGIDDFIQARESRWARYRSLGPALLGCASWLDDEALLARLADLSAACVVITKQRRQKRSLEKLQALEALNRRTPGIPVRAFVGLAGLVPRVDGAPTVGPFDAEYAGSIPTIRTMGFRQVKGETSLPPLIHVKLALLGSLWWHDEDAEGHVSDVIGFAPARLWVSSANFTASSRRSLEFGYWTEDNDLLSGAQRFLVKLMAASESLDPDADSPDPDLVPVEYDELAMAQAAADLESADDDVDDEPYD